jgi:hypothetical protein
MRYRASGAGAIRLRGRDRALRSYQTLPIDRPRRQGPRDLASALGGFSPPARIAPFLATPEGQQPPQLDIQLTRHPSAAYADFREPLHLFGRSPRRLDLAPRAATCDKPRALSAFSSIAALLLSVLLLIGGNALVGVTTPLRSRIDGFPDLVVGLLGSVRASPPIPLAPLGIGSFPEGRGYGMHTSGRGCRRQPRAPLLREAGRACPRA